VQAPDDDACAGLIRRSRLLVDGVLVCEAMITHASPLDGYDAGLKVQVAPGA
jgi:hypothetical protein